MNKLDEALVNLRQDIRDHKKQAEFYDLFLNYMFFVPILGKSGSKEEADGTKEILPVITEAGGKDYLMLFSSLERMKAWGQEEAEMPHIQVPGHMLAISTMEPLHWALNVGTEYSKQFHPEEIAWLRMAVEHCNAEAAKQQEGGAE